jgi:hypothetical protein
MNTTVPPREHYRSHDLADFAQEFLRRNAAYRAQFADLELHRRGQWTSPRCVAMARSWGLEFPLPS